MKIALIAGPVRANDRAGHHDYTAGCALVAALLGRLHDVKPIVIDGGWPEDERVLDDCAAAVFYDGGGGKQRFLASQARIQRMQQAIGQGMGLTVIHKAIAFPAALSDLGAAFRHSDYHRNGHHLVDRRLVLAVHDGRPNCSLKQPPAVHCSRLAYLRLSLLKRDANVHE